MTGWGPAADTEPMEHWVVGGVCRDVGLSYTPQLLADIDDLYYKRYRESVPSCVAFLKHVIENGPVHASAELTRLQLLERA